MSGNPSIEARGGLEAYLGIDEYKIIDAIMKNDAIIYKAAHMRRALNNRYSIPTCIKYANEWRKEHKNEQDVANKERQEAA